MTVESNTLDMFKLLRARALPLNTRCELEAPVVLSRHQMNTRPSPSDGYFPLLYMHTSLAHPRSPRCNASPESVEFPSAHSGVQQLEMCCIAPHRDAQLLSSTYHLLSRFPRQLIPRHYVNSVVK